MYRVTHGLTVRWPVQRQSTVTSWHRSITALQLVKTIMLGERARHMFVSGLHSYWEAQ